MSRLAMRINEDGSRNRADLQDSTSFDHVGRDSGATFSAGETLADIADTDPRIVVGCADLTYVTRLATFGARHPARFLYYGISERNMLGAAAGLATTGHIPYVCTFACFSGILGFENIRTDHAYPGLPVRILGTHAGVSMGFFGTSHHATEDIAALRSVAGLTILSAADAESTASLIRSTVDYPGPIYFRIGRGREAPVYTPGAGPVPGRPSELRSGRDLLIVATGAMVQPCLEAADKLAESGLSVTVLDVHTIKPFPIDEITAYAAKHRAVLTVEEHNVEGGLGSLTVEALSSAGIAMPIFKHGLRDEYALVGPPTHLYRYYGLDADGVATVSERLISLSHRGLIVDPIWSETDRQRVYALYGVPTMS